MRAVSAAFPALCVVSLGVPFAAGWLIGGTWQAALAARRPACRPLSGPKGWRIRCFSARAHRVQS